MGTFCGPRTTPLLRSGGLWRIPFARGRGYVVLERTEMNTARVGEQDEIGGFVGFVCFAGMGEIDTTGLRESTWYGLDSKS